MHRAALLEPVLEDSRVGQKFDQRSGCLLEESFWDLQVASDRYHKTVANKTTNV